LRTTQSGLRQLNELRLRTATAEAEALRRGRFDPLRLGADFKASAIVQLAAILEYVFREVSAELRAEVQSRCESPELLRTELAALVAHGAFAAASTANRSGLLQRVQLSKGPTLSTNDWPDNVQFADGRTIDAASFDAVWAVLALPGDSLPSRNHREALKEIKELRNKIAHGEDEAVAVGATKMFQDVLTRVGQVEDCLSRMDAALDTWLAARAWSV
jgi:hypothetical protein